MENRFLYRAKRIDNGRWVYGLPSYDTDGEIREIEAYEDADVEFYAVDPSTICQCTGLKDINGKLIWENDICDRKEKYPEIVKYTSGDWTLDYSYAYKKECGYTFCNLGFYVTERKSVKVIGNVFDNQNLLEGVVMTENEAIEELKYDCNELGKAIPCDTSWGKSFENAYAMAINALEEIEQYRTIGTVEECQKAMTVRRAVQEIVDQQLIAGENSYEEIYACFWEIVKVVQANY